MIYTNRKVTVRNGVSTIDDPVILYRGDKEVEVLFEIIDIQFKFKGNNGNLIDNTKASFGQLAIQNPDGYDTFTEIAACEDGHVIFKITGEMIDEIHEVGMYSFHIRLFDEDQTSRITIPHVQNGIEIKEPLVIEAQYRPVDPHVIRFGKMSYEPVNDNTVQLLDYDGSHVYPITHENAVLDENGVPISSKYQTKEDEQLNTVDKTIVGALNEINKIVNEDLINLEPSDFVYEEKNESTFDI